MSVKTFKKLIEVALPLEAINVASVREKSIRHGHPSTLHLWWARRPLAAARAVIFAQMVDDPSSHPDLFPTERAQEKERQRLFKIIEKLVQWENTTNEDVLNQARAEIWQSWRMTCAANADNPQAKELFNRQKLPPFHDPFSGGGALPLEAQRLGLEAYASDLNPVAVLICKAIIEIPTKFTGKPPVNPETRKDPRLFAKEWQGSKGLSDDVRYYGKWMSDEAEKRIGNLYPKIEITAEMAKDRSDLKPLVGHKLTVIAWLWARTVRSPNPAFADVDVPLATTFMLSTKPGKEAYVEPVIESNGYRFTVKVGKPKDQKTMESGTKPAGRGSTFECLVSKIPIDGKYIKSEAQAGRMGARLMAIVADGERGRIYLSPTPDMEAIALAAKPTWIPEQELIGKSADQLPLYGMKQYWQLFTPRQLTALTTFSDLVADAHDMVMNDALVARLVDDNVGLEHGGTGAAAYADAVAVYLGEAVSKLATFHNMLAYWRVGESKSSPGFGRQAIPMTWDFTEVNPFAKAGGDFSEIATKAAPRVIADFPAMNNCHAFQSDAAKHSQLGLRPIISTDPPYYNNICYADLSDYFYIWLRRSLRDVYPNLFATLVTPKTEELIASPYRHGNAEKAEAFFLNGMTEAMHRLAEQTHPAFPTTIYYAFKQSETETEGVASTGWETFLEAVIQAGFTLTGTWPMRTEQSAALKTSVNALASSIIMVCRPRLESSKATTRREFINRLKTELPIALANLQRGNIAPVDLEQAAIGPGMAIYTSYDKVLDAEGNSLSVRDALRLINQTLYEVLTEQEGDFDSDTRWALIWFAQFGFDEGDYGIAEQLSKSKNTSVGGMVSAGILESKSGRVRLFKPSELPSEWDPEKDRRLTVWEMVHQLIRVLEAESEAAAAVLVAKLGTKAEVARELAYRLYTVSERKKRSAEAGLYNGLVKSWPEILRLAQEQSKLQPKQEQMI